MLSEGRIEKSVETKGSQLGNLSAHLIWRKRMESLRRWQYACGLRSIEHLEPFGHGSLRIERQPLEGQRENDLPGADKNR